MSVLGLALFLSVATATQPPAPPADAVSEPLDAVGLGNPALPPPPPGEVQAIAYDIALGLRCPVCQGMSVADSTSEAAVMFQKRIQELVLLGYSQVQIEQYFVDRYGEWILLDPPPSGLNWLLWLAPGLAGGLGLALVASVVVSWRREPDEMPLPSDCGTVAKDPYEQALLAELEE